MSSFYKSNLMDKYDPSLIPAENDLKKVDDIEKNLANVEENKPGETTKAPVKNVDFPYKNIIKGSQYLFIATAVLLVFYEFCNTSPRDGGRLDGRGKIIPEKFLDPCNETNVIPLEEIMIIKNKIYGINAEKQSIYVVYGYNISSSANEYLAQKLANLTNAANNLQQQFDQQKEIRFICFKQNLEKRCKENSAIEAYKKDANAVNLYLIAATILILNSFYYISKAKKYEMTPEQKRECDHACACSKLIVIYHFAYFLLFLPIMSYLFPCNIEHDLDRFSM